MNEIKIKGGKVFNFENTPPAELKYKYNNNKLIVNLAFDDIELTPTCKADDQLEPYQSFAHLDKNEKYKLSHPCKTRVEKLDLDNNLIIFSKLGDNQKFSKGQSLQDKWSRSGLWLEAKNTITGKHIDPDKLPQRIFIQTFHTEPYHPDFNVLSQIPDIKKINEIFADLFGNEIELTLIVNKDNLKEFTKYKDLVDIFVLPNKYPATDPGILLTKKYYPYGYKSNPDKYWTFDIFTLINLFNLDEENDFPQCFFTVGGSQIDINGHYLTDYWFPLAHLLSENQVDPKTDLLIQGGLLNGEKQDSELATAIPGNRNFSFLKKRSDREFLHFLRPGMKRDSYSPLYLSFYLPRIKKKVSSGLRGEKRFCLSCNSCVDICPVGLDPQILWKLASNKLHEEAAALGAPRCLNCKLCTYVCPSKIEVSQKISSEKNYFFSTFSQEEN